MSGAPRIRWCSDRCDAGRRGAGQAGDLSSGIPLVQPLERHRRDRAVHACSRRFSRAGTDPRAVRGWLHFGICRAAGGRHRTGPRRMGGRRRTCCFNRIRFRRRHGPAIRDARSSQPYVTIRISELQRQSDAVGDADHRAEYTAVFPDLRIELPYNDDVLFGGLRVRYAAVLQHVVDGHQTPAS